ncbi:MAG: glycosyltransferase family 4 protein [Saprospiraceae bacterium]|jgi:glycosyltransferase involved in cell wall biosynthesis|nr:glycosyltransferase family 4 protein [Saprospiraceae bacterium]MBK7796183.1 glycosyltransferase family 4 protein [Saprospiraceae bacterium]
MLENKKIAIVANSTWNIYNFRQDLIRMFKAESCKVIVIAPIDEYIHYLNGSYFTKHIPLHHLNSQSQSPLEEWRCFWELYHIYRKEKPDIILHFTIKPNLYGSIAARFLKIPCVSTITGLGFSFLKREKLSTFFTLLYRFALRKNKRVLFHNDEDNLLFQKLNITSNTQGKVVPGSGVNTNYFHPSFNIINKDKFCFLFAGRLLKDKGLEEFIQASIQCRAFLKRAEFWVVGQLNEENPNTISKTDLLDWVEKRYIKYLGAEKDIRPIIAQCNVLVLPSYREGKPKSLLEAMSMAKPVITTDVPGCRDLVEHEINGLIVPPKDSFSLAEAMVRLYNMSDVDVNKMGLSGRSLVEDHFSIAKVLDCYRNIVTEILIHSNQDNSSVAIEENINK